MEKWKNNVVLSNSIFRMFCSINSCPTVRYQNNPFLMKIGLEALKRNNPNLMKKDYIFHLIIACNHNLTNTIKPLSGKRGHITTFYEEILQILSL